MDSLERLLCRPVIEKICKTWKDRHIPEQYMGDIDERKVWDLFKIYNGVSFLEEGFNYAFMLNCDWFQPFKRRKEYINWCYVFSCSKPTKTFKI